MTPEEKLQFEQMKRDIEELKQYVTQRKEQQLSFPLDPATTEIIQNI